MAYDNLFNMGRGRYDMSLFSEPSNLKQNHDRYDVYVNEEYIGQKSLLTAQESVQDIDDFLENEGYKNFKTFLDGDHYYIRAIDKERDVTDALKVYLQNR